MKSFLILSDNKEFKKTLTQLVVDKSATKLNYITVTHRTDAIGELSQKEFEVIVIDCSLSFNDLEIILKYLSTNNYYFSHIYFLSADFSLFKEIIDRLNFPHLNLISMPVDTNELALKIVNNFNPPDISTIDQTVKINLDFLKIFIDSTKRVMSEFCNLEKVNHGRPFLKNKTNQTPYGVVGKINLKSEFFDGIFTIGFPSEMYLNLVNKVLMIDATIIDDDSLDFAGELTNMIYGQAKFILNDRGHNFLKVIPTYDLNPVYLGNHRHHIVVVPMETEMGHFYIEVDVFKINGISY